MLRKANEFKTDKHYLYLPEYIKANPQIDLPLQKRAIIAYQFLYGPRPQIIEIINGYGYCKDINISPDFCAEFDNYGELTEYLWG